MGFRVTHLFLIHGINGMFVPRSNHGAHDKVTTEYSEITEYTESLKRTALTVHMVRMLQKTCKLRKTRKLGSKWSVRYML